MKLRSYLRATALALLTPFNALALDLYVAPNGSDNNPGTLQRPLKTMEGARAKLSGVSRSQTIRVNFRAGTYFPAKPAIFRAADSGQDGRPIVYRSYPGETAFFDGARFIGNSGFTRVPSNLQNRLPSVARSKTFVQVIQNAELRRLLADPNAILSVNSRPQFLATYPNVGFLTATNKTAGSGNGSHANPTGDIFSVAESFPFRALETELRRGGKQAYADGYLDTEFARRRTPIGRMGGSGASRFVLTKITGPNFSNNNVSRCRIANFLYGLDSPGEWYFDTTDNRLYFWPLSGSIKASDRIGITGGGGVATCVGGVKNLRFERMVFRNIGGTSNGVIYAIDSNNIEVAGCTFQSIVATQPTINYGRGTTNSKITSCDFIDNGRSVILAGGSYNKTSVNRSNNIVNNCHFGYWQSRHFTAAPLAVGGAGNTVRNSVFHNIGSQSLVHSGVDHNFLLNEFFNIGFEEGDGGATYTGAEFFSFGNLFRNNFAHHLIHVPGLIGRAAFFSDDYDAGETYDANVFYKCGDTGVKLNAGSGHTVTNNVVISSRRGIALLGRPETYKRLFDVAKNILRTDPNRNSKPNYIGRAEKVIGDFANNSTATYNSSWSNSFWAKRYPTLLAMLRNPNGRVGMYPTQVRFYNNGFLSNSKDTEFSPGFAAVRGSVKLANSRFKNVNNLDFQFNTVPSGMKNIPFGSIGLRTDSYRKTIPNKNTYRSTVRKRFAGESSYRNGRYSSSVTNTLVYYNSGPLLMPGTQSGLGVKQGDALKNSSGSPTPPPTPPSGGGDQDTGTFVNRNEYLYDFGTPSSPVFNGYRRLTERTTRGYVRWSNNSGLNSADRGSANNELNRDFVYSSAAKTLIHQVANGNYRVTVNLFDANSRHDNMQVKAEGQVKLSNQTWGAGSGNKTLEFEVNVTDGNLNLEFSDQGGNDPNWVLNRLVVTKIESSSPPPPPSGGGGSGTAPRTTSANNTGSFVNAARYQWDFGTASSPLSDGYSRVTEATTQGYARWTNNSGLNSVDRGGSQNALNRDFVYSSSAKTFSQQIANGTYEVAVNLFDANYRHDNMQVRAEGQVKLSNQTFGAGSGNETKTFNVTVSDGRLDLEFSDQGGNDRNWVLSRIVVTRSSGGSSGGGSTGGGGTSTARQFDFGTTSSPLFSGYTRVSPNTRSGAYRWTNTVNAADRGTTGNNNEINRDFIYSNQSRNFEVTGLANGNWQVEVTIGDASYPHDNIRVRTRGGIIFDSETVNANQFKVESRIQNVTDNKVVITFSDQGGTDANWVVTRVRLLKQ